MKSSGIDGKTVVVVGTVTDDVRIFDIPALKVMSTKLKHQGRSPKLPCHWILTAGSLYPTEN